MTHAAAASISSSPHVRFEFGDDGYSSTKKASYESIKVTHSTGFCVIFDNPTSSQSIDQYFYDEC